jgi:hypothetical protein
LNPITARSQSSRRALAMPTIAVPSLLTRIRSERIFDTDRVYLMRVDGNMMVKSPRVFVPMTGETSVAEFDFLKAD